ncbi:MAG: YIP1 family protein [Bacteroidales bacterium]|nr:YIP1 family protein [Bacteroidales bacterium]
MDYKKIWERIKAIISSPNTEWDKIAAEPNDQNEMLINYVVPLVALGAITTFIGKASLSEYTVYQGFMLAITYFISMVAGIYISAVIVSELEPGFNIKQDFGGTLKLIVYSATAVFVASIIANLHPGLSFIGLFGLYGLYLFWVGQPKIMKVDEDKRVGFVLISALIILAITFIINFILQSIFVSSAT